MVNRPTITRNLSQLVGSTTGTKQQKPRATSRFVATTRFVLLVLLALAALVNTRIRYNTQTQKVTKMRHCSGSNIFYRLQESQ